MNVYFKIKGEMRLCNITSLKRSAIFLLWVRFTYMVHVYLIILSLKSLQKSH